MQPQASSSFWFQNKEVPFSALLCLALLLALFFPGTRLHTQELPLQALPSHSGLSQNMIFCLMRDSDGFLWVGTQDGLNRYDAYQFKVYRHDPYDTTSITDNRIADILQDRAGRIWVATEQGLNLYDKANDNFIRLLPQPGLENSLSHKKITDLMEDRQGALWVSTGQGINRLTLPLGSKGLEDLRITSFTHDPNNPNSPNTDRIEFIAQDAEGTFWMQSGWREIQRFAFESLTFSCTFSNDFDFLPDSPWKKEIENGDRTFLAQGKNETIWLGVGNRLIRWDARANHYTTFPLPANAMNEDSIDWNNVRYLMEDKVGRVWVSHLRGLFTLDWQTGGVNIYNPPPNQVEHPFSYGVWPILEDPSGLLWIGTSGRGLYQHDPNTARFAKAGATRNEWSLWNGNSIRSLLKTRDGTLWMCPANSGIYILDRNTGEKHPIHPTPPGVDVYEITYGLYQDKQGALWAAPKWAGLMKFKTWDETGKVTFDGPYYPDSMEAVMQDDVFYDVRGDDRGLIWVCTRSHIGYFNPGTETYTLFPFPLEGASALHQLKHSAPAMFLDGAGSIWIGSSAGIMRFDTTLHTFSRYVNDPNDRNSLSQNVVLDILADPASPERYFWIATSGGGLNRLDIQQDSFLHFGEEDGLPDRVIYGILPDEIGNLWLSTNKGLSAFNPASQTFRNFDEEDGLQHVEFNTNAYSKSEDGELLFGGISGLNAFFPEEVLLKNKVPPSVKLTDFKVLSEPVPINGPKGRLKSAIEYADKVMLTHADKTFSFGFAALSYPSPHKNRYAYKMDGFDADWQDAGNSRSATYTNLDPGEYTFRVKAANSDGVWNEAGASILVTILPPWWNTLWAWAIYALLALGFAFWLRQNERRKQHLKFQFDLEHLEAAKLKEMDHIKSRFYTNITHEFRTPLTVILGIAEGLGKSSQLSLEESSRIIRRNGKNLLHLVNQLLDLSRLESKAFVLKPQQEDIVMFLRYVTESFQTYANSKNLHLAFFSSEQKLVMDFDPEQLRKVMINLLSNAFKFTPSEGKISVDLSRNDDLCMIAVSDTGPGIAEVDQPFIFNRFYQASRGASEPTKLEHEGSGIGLAHTRELVKHMEGSISVESELDRGTTLHLQLPIRNDAPYGQPAQRPEEVDTGMLPVEAVTTDDNIVDGTATELPQLLIIEDNADVVVYLKNCLQGLFQITVAYNGDIGLRRAVEDIPDMIICDVMMPGKDGFEVCGILKEDERSSHIPVVMLTAKADPESRLEGLKRGADAYLAKPFDREELLIRLERLVEVRKRMKAHFAGGGAGTEKEFPMENAFLKKVNEIIAREHSNELFGLPALCRALGLSRSQLYRKLKALIDDSPAALIRTYRLREARKLLESTDLTVAEVTFRVGFKDASHFSKAYQEEYGLTPSETRN